jgi:hypothetical protein
MENSAIGSKAPNSPTKALPWVLIALVLLGLPLLASLAFFLL